MGIDVHALNFLRYVAKVEPLGRVATIGRQSLLVSPAQIAGALKLPKATEFGLYCEDLFKQHLGAELVDSYDYSDYEGATFTADMNKPLASARQYDTVIDIGSLEHVYNVPQGLANVSQLCRKGGRLVHISPGNNFCGHGFWQFSPELFFSLYSGSNGYADTEVFLADLTDQDQWFKVQQPTNGIRAEVVSSVPLHVMCKARKIADSCHNEVQQSDYVQVWKGERYVQNETLADVKKFVRSKPKLFRAFWAVRGRLRRLRNPTSLSNQNPHLKKLDVAELLVA
jgi:hypothetical protein